jgi:hypothetical protein
VNRFRAKRIRGVDDVVNERFAGERMQDFRQRRAHACTLTGGEDNDFE